MAPVKFWDVNIWVYAFRKDSPYHEKAHNEIQQSLADSEPFLFSPHVAASFLRIVTNPKIFVNPSSIAEAWTFVDVLESSIAAKKADMDDMAFGIFKHICFSVQAAGNRVPDAVLAAMAIRHDAEFVSADAGFAAYPGLRLKVLS